MIVVCDTNVFVRETHLLRKKGGPQLIRLLRTAKGRLFVPEILQKEYIEQTRLAASEERGRASAAISSFKTLVGDLDDRLLPGDEVVDQRTLERLASLDELLLSAPMTKEVLAAAGERSLQKRRPTSKSDHGYKDCLIWESVLRLPRGSEVRFISRDNKAFFEGDNFAPELVDEARNLGIVIAGYRELERALRELQAGMPSLDLAAVEAQDFIERQAEAEVKIGPAVLSATAVHAPPGRHAPVAESSDAVEGDAGLADQKLVSLLTGAQKPFENLDRTVLGCIAYLGDPTKHQLFELLGQLGIAIELARNVAERLAISGLIRDTGNHYLPNDAALAKLAAAAMEPEIIQVLAKGS
ncbi:hypothetical protein EI171_28900 [Bradyrhizobium sp. LCT2]|uniref:PIN domain-containing protein n=1 Tax=Bradyrhizobium sp. LCT2 TaxID=2493093 RepID=UPI001373B879|nr:PIN domain-containing protein [Bradyrhizobium sp. LCT2]QHP70956.1 hypothetical protein EI171_28900 [Bradyrhizobium sp. LCT2]